MNIDKQLKAFEKTDRFKQLVAEKMKTNPKFNGVQEVVTNLGNRMKEILRDEILSIKSETTGESFLDHIVISEKFITNVGWTINVSFDADKMYRDSLFPTGYPDGAQINILFNEGYNAKTSFGGIDRHGNVIATKQNREPLYFIQRAVDRFNAEQKGKNTAEYSSKYTGGKL